MLGGRRHGACPAGLRQHPQNTAWAEVTALQAAARSGTGSGPSAANMVTLCIKHFTSRQGASDGAWAILQKRHRACRAWFGRKQGATPGE